jgi:hypothetical protein
MLHAELERWDLYPFADTTSLVAGCDRLSTVTQG